MEKESFEDEQVAAILNRDFISIKVDREERPDIDTVYMSVCLALNGSGGWPLTIIMTPEQVPFYAGTYLPKKHRFQTIGLMELLPALSLQWTKNRAKLLETGKHILSFLQHQSVVTKAEPTPDKAFLKKAAREYHHNFDSENGGFGLAPKFPAPHNLLFLIHYSCCECDDPSRWIVEKTLTQMYRGGIFDHIGGGFSRYATDAIWLVPHFEKMLYDNALLAYTYLETYQVTKYPLYLQIAERTLNYVLDELTDEKGGFFCGQDADSDGVEGKYYVFSCEELTSLLGKKEGDLFCKKYDIREGGNFEGKSIPNLLLNNDYIDAFELLPEALITKLQQYRLTRTSLHKDDKILTSWNALMITAFAKAAKITDRQDYLDIAKNACYFIQNELTDQDGRLLIRWRDGEAANAGQLDDYAFFAWALIELYQSSYEIDFLMYAVNIASQMLSLFWDNKEGGFFLYSSDAEQLISRPKEAYDGAVPSGNSVAALLLGRLFRLTGNHVWMEYHEKQLRFLGVLSKNHPSGYGFALLAMAEALYPSRELICCIPNMEMAKPLFKLLNQQVNFNLTLLIKTPENADRLDKLTTYTSAYPIQDGKTVYYLCQNGACHSPVTEINELEKLLKL